MAQRTASFRRARCLFAYWEDDRLIFYNFARRKIVSGRPTTCDILDFFAEWRTVRQAIRRFDRYSPQSVISTLSQLSRHRLLLRKGSREAQEDSRIAKEWSAWLPEGGFHFATKDARYIRRHLGLAQMRALLPKTPQPKFFKSISGAKKMSLPARTFPKDDFIRVLMSRSTHRQFSSKPVDLKIVSQLLSLVWGVTGSLYSPLFGALPLKTSPSAGARHPGEVYLMALRVNGLRPGLYHYQARRHQLETISTRATASRAALYCARQRYVRGAAALFIMTAVFPRTMWKYGKPRAYRVVLLDTGHLCQTFCLVATWLGLAPFCTAAFKDTLIEKDLKIDGIRESVLYVAGVGVATTRRTSSVASL
jgi:SagB-type dehydrogenase family enzyme